MTAQEIKNWQDVHSEVLSRIHSRQWKPGDFIPNEADLAREFGCARATVNRALQAIAEAGLLDRKRKAGTRVATNPVRKATLRIPIIRQEIESQNKVHSYQLVSSQIAPPPKDIQNGMKLKSGTDALHLIALHLADNIPYVAEDRWINPGSVRDIQHVDFSQISANEWLVAKAPFTSGDISFSASQADPINANLLDANPGEALFVIERITWNQKTAITSVRQTFHPGYRMNTTL